MRNSHAFFGSRRAVALLVVAAAILCGCESKQEKALDQAKKQAAATGQAQQVVSVDKNGTTTTTLVQPPAPGQANQAVTTTQTKPAPGAPIPQAADPVVSAAPPPPPPPPVSVTVPAGTQLDIRIDQEISVKTSRDGDTFTGEVVAPVLASDGSAIVPQGAHVEGVVVESHRGGHFKGGSVLELQLTSLTLNGTRYRVDTSDVERTKKGKGKRSTAMIGGGTGLGMLVGGLTHGPVGLIVGGLAGGGGGAAAAGLTGNRSLEIPAETVVHFRLAGDLVVKEAA